MSSGLSSSRHPNQSAILDRVWDERTRSRSPIVLTRCCPQRVQEVYTLHVVNPICCGIGVHAASLVACLRRISADGQITLERREFGTTYSELLTLGDWLVAERCPIVALESTGVYWKPIYHVLSGLVEVLVGNPQEIRQRLGKKTDKADATWIAELLAHGLIRPSFIPPPAIRALRDLTRTRVALVQTRTQAKSQVHKILEDTNIKLATVVSDQGHSVVQDGFKD